MKKTTIRILCLALCVLFVLGMAGCGKAKTSSEASSDTTDSNAFLEFDNEKGEALKTIPHRQKREQILKHLMPQRVLP